MTVPDRAGVTTSDTGFLTYLVAGWAGHGSVVDDLVRRRIVIREAARGVQLFLFEPLPTGDAEVLTIFFVCADRNNHSVVVLGEHV